METENNLNYFSCLRDFVKLSVIFKIRWLNREENRVWRNLKVSLRSQRKIESAVFEVLLS